MNIQLNIKDRLIILSNLPENGSISQMTEVLELINLISITEQEKEDVNMKNEDNKIYWNINKEEYKEFDININQINIIKELIKKLDLEGKVNLYNLDFCLKFNKL